MMTETAESLLEFAIGVARRIGKKRHLDLDECDSAAGLAVAEVMAEQTAEDRKAAINRRIRDHLAEHQVRESRYETPAEGFFDHRMDVGKQHRKGGLTSSEERSILTLRKTGKTIGEIATATGLPLWKVSQGVRKDAERGRREARRKPSAEAA